MFCFKESLLALVCLFGIVVALAALTLLVGLGQKPGPKQPPPSFGRPGNFYLTKTTHNGAQALTACAAGYHMASIWEIYDPSSLTYSTVYGFTRADSGLGPPTYQGWIRTGDDASSSNCLAWTTADGSNGGRLVNLIRGWLAEEPLNPWFTYGDGCNANHHVWCVQD
jgi:hypothetical protein